MLLPSAITCDSSSQPRLQAALFASPPASPSQTSQSALGNIFTTCRSLQALLATSAPTPLAMAGQPTTPPGSHALLPPQQPQQSQQSRQAQQPRPQQRPRLRQKQPPTPPLLHATAQPLKLRLCARRSSANAPLPNIATVTVSDRARKRIVKRMIEQINGPNKRRRPVEDDMGRDDVYDLSDNNEHGHDTCCDDEDVDDLSRDGEDDMGQNNKDVNNMGHNNDVSDIGYSNGDVNDISCNNEDDYKVVTATARAREPGEAAPAPRRLRTPKRARIAPEVLPLGLERSDYHALHALPRFRTEEAAKATEPETQAQGSDVVVEKDGATWSTEEDRILVELVLEKLKLSKSDWQDCARSLGKDRGSVGRRWKSLVVNGEIGVRRNGHGRRGKIHGTWR